MRYARERRRPLTDSDQSTWQVWGETSYEEEMTRRHSSKHEDDLATPFTLGEMGPRAVRLEHLLFEEVDRLFRLEINDRRVQRVVPMSVQLSPDLRNAKVLYALREGPRPIKEREVHDGLERVKPFVRARIAEALALKRTPDLHFHRDRMAEASLRAEAVLLEEHAAANRAERAQRQADAGAEGTEGTVETEGTAEGQGGEGTQA
jgi:ribosome-binding factor A